VTAPVDPVRRSGVSRRGGAILLFVASASALVFAALATTAASGRTSSWDSGVFAALYSGEATHAPGGATGSSSPSVHRAVAAGNLLGSWEILTLFVAVVALVLVVRGRGGAAVFLVAGSAVALLVPVLKQAFGRTSPFPEVGVYGFPSGHAMGPMAVAASCVVLLWWTSWRTLVLVVGAIAVTAIGVAAVSDGGHWPSDVLGGWLLALAWVCTIAWAHGWWCARARARPSGGATTQETGGRGPQALRPKRIPWR